MRFTTPAPRPQPREKPARKPLRRSRMKRKAPRRLKTEQSNPAYLSALEETCFAAELGNCGPWYFDLDGSVKLALQVCHMGEKPGTALKCNDLLCLKGCYGHHVEWDQRRGAFFGWSEEQRRSYIDPKIAAAQIRFAAIQAREAEQINREVP